MGAFVVGVILTVCKENVMSMDQRAVNMGCYIRKTVSKYSEKDLKKAVNEVKKNNKTTCSMSRKYGIPRSTLQRWINTTQKRCDAGRSTILPIKNECHVLPVICSKMSTPERKSRRPAKPTEKFKKYLSGTHSSV